MGRMISKSNDSEPDPTAVAPAFGDFRKKMDSDLWYPFNHDFDPETLEPIGFTRIRFDLLKQNAPELFQGGKSFLDIGSNKGFFCLHFSQFFDSVTGYEPSDRYYVFSNALKNAHGRTNVHFEKGGLRDVSFERKHEIVYVGNCHHYMFSDAVAYQVPEELFLKKLAAITERILILDGPFDLHDGAVKKLAKKNRWPRSSREKYCIDWFARMLQPQFELLRFRENGYKRMTAVFERKQPNIQVLNNEHLKSELLRSGAKELSCNPNREPGSVLKHEQKRYKFERRPLPEGIYLILNALPEFFPEFHSLITVNQKCIGDVAEFVSEAEPPFKSEILEAVLRLNNALSTVGLVELDYEETDFKRKGKHVVKVDVDMVRHIVSLQGVLWKGMFLKKARRAWIKEKDAHLIMDHLNKRDLYYKMLKRYRVRILFLRIIENLERVKKRVVKRRVE